MSANYLIEACDISELLGKTIVEIRLEAGRTDLAHDWEAADLDVYNTNDLVIECSDGSAYHVGRERVGHESAQVVGTIGLISQVMHSEVREATLAVDGDTPAGWTDEQLESCCRNAEVVEWTYLTLVTKKGRYTAIWLSRHGDGYGSGYSSVGFARVVRKRTADEASDRRADLYC